MRRPLSMMAALAAPLVLSGCLFSHQYEFDYAVNPAVMAEGSPQPVGSAVSSGAGVSASPFPIDPTKAAGYDSLPDEYKKLYGPNPREVGLNDVVQGTLGHNRNISIEVFSHDIAGFQIPIQKSIYDLIIEGSAQAVRRKDRTGNPPEFIAGGQSGQFGGFFTVSPLREVHTRDYSALIRQLIPTGATVEVEYAQGRTYVDPSTASTFNPDYNQSLTATITQPLLRGRGPRVTNAEIRIAQIDHQISAAQLETQIQDQINGALAAYWDLTAAVKNYDVSIITYLAGLDLLRINEAKERAGVMAQTEVLQAKASVEARREQVIRARQAVRDSEDILKQFAFFQEGSPAWTLELQPTQLLTWREIEIDPEAVLAEALAERPELRSSEGAIRVAEEQTIVARNAMQPQLDLFGSAGLTGRGDNYNDSKDLMETNDYNTMSAGIQFSFPFQNRQARFIFRQRVTEKGRAEEQYRQIEDQVVFDVRAAVRELRTARERIDITRARVESEQANLQAELKRYEVGVSTSFEVIEFQDDLANAAFAHIQAITDYNKATFALERARGTLLKTYGIVVSTPDLAPEHEKVLFPIGFN